MTTTNASAAPTDILLIRHGETAWNAERRLQGHLDIPLNDEGERQAALLAGALAGEPLDLIIASDLRRAHQTAQAVADRRGLTVAIDPALRERGYGGFEGLLYSEIEERFPREFAAWQARDVDAQLPPGRNVGESFRSFFDRATGAILALAVENPGKTIALVAHGGVLECAYRLARGLPLETPRDFKVYNASINRFRFDPADRSLVLGSWGEVDHLRPAVLDELP
ncbi:histidine phosphatase family protein [Telluria mixta]|uniref:Histidine phosphatase family protein n=1 Tax=Telluria mixta TaxID=34071 RepID=A0ABT2BWF5_9BURK|nr:histidine phosphatase family protein [Telluria mixta]MCS0629450.1 histidine phosphatase family protein [Telluria mixta]WEM96974.1 histidine phosphatase family protein [Telluria mixta]